MGKVGKKVTRKTKDKLFLSDGIILNILSRLPAKCAVRCRLVCREWRDLTFTVHFMDLHLRNSIPSIIVTIAKIDSGLGLLGIDKSLEPAGTGFMIHRFPGNFSITFSMLFSHAGLIVLHDNISSPVEDKFIIQNPISPECVTISFPKKLMKSKIYGVYFHLPSKEFHSLWKISELGPSYDQPKQIDHYNILNLSSNPVLKTIRNPFSHRVKRIYGEGEPLLINNYLYWLLESRFQLGSMYTGHNDIMKFDIISEEFITVIPCPIPSNTKCKECQTLLLNIEGILSFLLVYDNEIIVWKLEGDADAGKLWTALTYTLSVDVCRSLTQWYENHILPLPIAVVNGELALKLEGKLLVCNLMDGTVKKYPRNKFRGCVNFFPFQMSLASLKNCRSAISIDKDGEELQVRNIH